MTIPSRLTTGTGAVMLLFAMLFLNGCNVFYSEQPIGNTLGAKDKLNLSGVYTKDGHPIYIKQLANGEVRIAGMKWQNHDFKKVQYHGLLTKLHGQYYLNLQLQDKTDAKGKHQPYAFFSIVAKKNELLMFSPNVDIFKRAVQAGKLAGTVTGKDNNTTVHLTARTSQLNAFVQPKLGDEQFPLDGVTVLHRIGDAHALQ